MAYDSVDTIEGRDAIRRVPGMYISELGKAGYAHMAFEVLDNSVDEALGGYCTNIEIILDEDESVTIKDNGRGIPVGLNDKGVSYLNTSFEIHSGGKFLKTDGSQGSYKKAGGLHGVGIAIVAALSDRAECTSYRDGKAHTVYFRKGKYGAFEGEGRDAKFTEKPNTFFTVKKDTRSREERKNNPTGTTLKFWVDHEFMDADEDDLGNILPAEIDRQAMIDRVENTSYLVPGLSIRFVDRRNGDNYDQTFYSPGGIDDLVSHMQTAKSVNETITFSGNQQYTTRGESKDLSVDISLSWENSNKLHRRSFVNIIQTKEGGTHETGFLAGLHEAIVEAAESKNIKKAKDPDIEIEDVCEGLSFVVSASLPRPAYAGQTKAKLTEAPVKNAVKNITKEYVTEWLTSRSHASDANAIIEKALSAARSRKARDSKFSIRDVVAEPDKKTLLGLMPSNLKDCTHHGPDSGAELFIVEGESALGSLLTSRDSDFQAVYPLKGKPLNVYSVSEEKLFIPPEPKSNKTPTEKKQKQKRQKFIDAGHLLLQNKEYDGLIKAIGTGFGSECDMSKRRFDRICIGTDADVDGLHITVILFILFYTHLRQWITEGRLYVTQPPLYVITYGSKSNPEQAFALNAIERDEIIEELKKDKKKILDVGRRKGLGESTVKEMQTALMNKHTRILKQVTFDDIQEVAEKFNLLFGNDTQLRKDWISSPETQKLLRG